MYILRYITDDRRTVITRCQSDRTTKVVVFGNSYSDEAITGDLRELKILFFFFKNCSRRIHIFELYNSNIYNCQRIILQFNLYRHSLASLGKNRHGFGSSVLHRLHVRQEI